MTPRRLAGLLVAIALAGAVAAEAQGAGALVGTWERVSLLDSAGTATQPPAPVAYLIFTADGMFSQIAIPGGRPQGTTPLAEMTKEALLARFQRVEARYGSYTAVGNRLTRKHVSSISPNQEGTDAVQLFRVEGGMLILSSANPAQKNEARWKRAK